MIAARDERGGDADFGKRLGTREPRRCERLILPHVGRLSIDDAPSTLPER